MKNNKPSALLSRIFRDKSAVTLDGETRQITGGISLSEALVLQDLIAENNCNRCVETGVAYGVSTAAICEAIQRLPDGARGKVHYGIDPYQHKEHGGAALRLLRDSSLDGIFRLLEGPTHLMAPGLIEQCEQVDLAFIDGYHTFDYSLIDFFFLDKCLKAGGLLALHDTSFPSKKKLVNFILTHRAYRIEQMPTLRVGVARRIGGILRGLKHLEPMWYKTFPCGGNMIVLRKTQSWEPDWHFFKNF